MGQNQSGPQQYTQEQYNQYIMQQQQQMRRRPVQQQRPVVQQQRPVVQQQRPVVQRQPEVRREEYKKKSDKFYKMPGRGVSNPGGRLESDSSSLTRGNNRSSTAANRFPDSSVLINQPRGDYRVGSQDALQPRGNRGAPSAPSQSRVSFDPSIRIQEPSAADRGNFHMQDESSDMAYKILGVSPHDNLETVTATYRQLARLNHPDKGGDPEVFNDIKQSYQYIKNKLMDSDDYRINQPVRKTNYNDSKDEFKGMRHRDLGGGKFNQDRFNQVFEQSRLDDPFMDKGYGHLMDRTQRTEGVPTAQGNEEFNDNSVYDIIKYEEPKAYVSSSTSLGFVDLDEHNVNDFTGQLNDRMGFTDYKRAFHQNNHIETMPEGYELEGRARSIDQYQAQRDNISHQMSHEEQERRRQIEAQRDAEERERRRRYEERRRREQQHYDKTHIRMLTD